MCALVPVSPVTEVWAQNKQVPRKDEDDVSLFANWTVIWQVRMNRSPNTSCSNSAVIGCTAQLEIDDGNQQLCLN